MYERPLTTLSAYPPGVSGRATDPGVHPTFGQAARFWTKLGFINFGGPSGQIAVMHTELVDERRWISDGRFFHALNYCMLLPGPEAMQLATYVGWLLHGVGGGLLAGVMFFLPSYFLMMVLSWLAAAHSDVTWLSAIFGGLGAAVVGIVFAALIRVGTKTLRNPVMVLVAILAFAAVVVVGVPFPFIVIAAGLVGLGLGQRWPAIFSGQAEAAERDDEASGDAVLHDEADTPAHAGTSARRTITVLIIGLAAWILPLVWISSLDLRTPVFGQTGLFFSQAALVTFGGAYAVLAYINTAAVFRFGWLSPGQMVTGLGFAESTPGPLIMVVQFVGFLAGYRFHGSLSPVMAGILAGTVAVWATFAPCFLWIFLGGPYIEKLRGNERLGSALATITAAIVGVIGSLALFFTVNTLFTSVSQVHVLRASIPIPDPGSIDWFSTLIAVISFLGIWRWRWNIVAVIGGAAVAGLAWSFVS